jgi:hypothetical protein
MKSPEVLIPYEVQLRYNFIAADLCANHINHEQVDQIQGLCGTIKLPAT